MVVLHLIIKTIFLFRGRWKDTKSAERYIQTGVALLKLYDVPINAFHIGCHVIDNFQQYIDAINSSLFQ
jgi:hypothetical protein